VPLARVFWKRFAATGEDQILSVDNCGFRPLAPGVQVQRALQGAPAASDIAPRLIEIIPADGAAVPGSTTSGTFTIRAVANATLAEVVPSSDGYEIVYYPPTGEPQVFESGDGPAGAFVRLSVNHSPNPANASNPPTPANEIQLRLVEVPAPGLPEGTYVWRLLNNKTPGSGAPELKAASNQQQLDGNPGSMNAVPSGDGVPGGAFEARFIVRKDG
jgi:hypothetical protein